MRLRPLKRPGVTVVECALVYPAVFLFILGLIIGAAGIFRYQELASLARRAARYAAVHGQQYAKETGNTVPTSAEIYNTVIAPNAVALASSKLDYAITYTSNKSPATTKLVNGELVTYGNTVSVTINYQWVPEGFLGGIKLSSTSVMPMAY